MTSPQQEMDGATVAAAARYLHALSRSRRPDPEAERAWRGFYRYADRLVREFIGAFGVPPHERDDCAQDVWVRVMDRLKDLRFDADRARFSTWLYTVVRSVAVDRHRRSAARSRRVRTVSLNPYLYVGDAAVEPPRMDRREVVQMALACVQRRTSAPNRELIRRRWLRGQPVEDVAEALGLTRQQVWAREHRLRKTMRELIVQFLQQED